MGHLQTLKTQMRFRFCDISSGVYKCMCLVVTCWERAYLLALICGVLLWVCHFPIGILGQAWYLIESIPDLYTLTYFVLFIVKSYFMIYQPAPKKSF